jgi:hypothetical protein
MFTQTISPEFAAQIEAGEVNAWVDMYAAAPANFARQFQLDIIRRHDIVLTRCKTIPFIHFNAVKNLGMASPASEAQLDELIAIYHDAGVPQFWIYHTPHAQPTALPKWLEARGLHPRSGWERIYRTDAALTSPVIAPDDRYRVEKVTLETGPEWANFIDTTYGLPTTPWLLALVERQGWHHYLLRHNEQNGQIVSVRSLHVDDDGMGWLGIDAPVPGMMGPTYDLDLRICQQIVQDGPALGVKCFVADIEAPDPEMNTPAYRNFESLGFKRPYYRSHYCY